MLPERRQELVRRRQQLHERRRQQLAEQHRRYFIAPLDEAGVVYSIAETDPLLAWITARFTVDQYSSIVWKASHERQCTEAEAQNASEWLEKLASEKELGDPVVAAVFAADDAPCLKLRYSELAKHAETIIDFNWQTWVFDPSSDWIIEFHHDLGWCWGRSAEPSDSATHTGDQLHPRRPSR